MLRSLVLSAWCACAMTAWAADEPKPRDAAALEKEFSEKLTGAALVGTFSVDGRDGAKAERYEIASAKKLEGNNWIVAARIKYGDKDVTVPIVVQVFWADDTPMITLTNLTIPGMGTFTSRVMFYGHRYAGTWQHDKVGGHMWGVVEKKSTEEKPDEKTEKKD
jgi:hypothetical protein